MARNERLHDGVVASSTLTIKLGNVNSILQLLHFCSMLIGVGNKEQLQYPIPS